MGLPSIAQQPVHTSNTGWWLDVWAELQGAVNSLSPFLHKVSERSAQRLRSLASCKNTTSLEALDLA